MKLLWIGIPLIVLLVLLSCTLYHHNIKHKEGGEESVLFISGDMKDITEAVEFPWPSLEESDDD